MNNIVDGLFSEVLPFESQYTSLDAELSAIARGDKAMSFFPFPTDAILEGPIDLYFDIVGKAAQFNLHVTQVPAHASHEICVFVHKAEHAWRVPAFMRLRQVLKSRSYVWSDGLEAVQSDLLGYSDVEIARWIVRQRERSPSFSGVSMYLLVPAGEMSQWVALGMRVIPTTSQASAVYKGDDSVIQPVASDLLPSTVILCRVAVKEYLLVELFGEDMSVKTKAMSESIAAHLNANLQSKVEVAENGVWK